MTNRTVEPAHTTEVVWQRAWSEWLARCSCGWVGSYVQAKADAEYEAKVHLDA